ncbi:LIC11966 family surface protein [Flavitalea flava]
MTLLYPFSLHFTRHCLGLFLLSFSYFLFPAEVLAQTTDNPGDYMSSIAKARGDMDIKYMQYLSAVAHGRHARKVEKLRQEVLDNILQCKYNTTDIHQYKGDNSLRKGSIDYIQVCYLVFSEDYKKIVNIEELAEQSVDEMQVYLLLEEKVNDKLKEASADLQKTTKEFAAKYNVTLIEEKNALSEKMETAGKLNTYSNQVYLAFFKCNWEDGQMVTAMNNKKVNDVEQARSAMLSYAAEGLKSLDTLKTFDGDPSLANACRQALQFYKNAAEKEVPKLTDFYLKEEDFAKLKKSFEEKSSKERTKQDVDAYNKAVKEVNESVNSFNQTNNNLNNNRKQTLNNWQESQKRFADDHMPHYG